jgi:transcriptional regulator with XRE-family HTH domain
MTSLRELRDRRGWSQAELAAKIDVSPSTIYNWESGKTRARSKQLRALERLFEVPYESIELTEESPGKLLAAAA